MQKACYVACFFLLTTELDESPLECKFIRITIYVILKLWHDNIKLLKATAINPFYNAATFLPLQRQQSINFFTVDTLWQEYFYSRLWKTSLRNKVCDILLKLSWILDWTLGRRGGWMDSRKGWGKGEAYNIQGFGTTFSPDLSSSTTAGLGAPGVVRLAHNTPKRWQHLIDMLT